MEPLCGYDWLHKHQNDHTQAEIDALSIEVTVAGKRLPRVESKDMKRKEAREILRENMKGE
jgi:hypothetical protein